MEKSIIKVLGVIGVIGFIYGLNLTVKASQVNKSAKRITKTINYKKD